MIAARPSRPGRVEDLRRGSDGNVPMTRDDLPSLLDDEADHRRRHDDLFEDGKWRLDDPVHAVPELRN
jgi:hypothetical protein